MPDPVEAPVEDTPSEAQLAFARGDILEDPDKEVVPEPEVAATPADDAPAETDDTPAPDAAAADDDITPEPEPEPEPEPRKPIMLPKTRYDAAMSRARAAEEKLAEYEANPPTAVVAAQPAAPAATTAAPEVTFDAQIDALDEKIDDAVADGDTKEATTLRREQRTLINQATDARIEAARTDTSTILDETRAELAFDSLLAQVEAAHPEADPTEGNESYDEGIVNQVNRLMNGFMQQGSNKIEALEEALGYIYPEGWDSQSSEPEASSAPDPEPAPAPEPKKTNIDANLEAANAQSPEMVAGDDSTTAGIVDAINPMKLTEKQFDALSEEQLSKLRGDTL